MATTYLTQSLHRARAFYPERTATVFGERRRTYGELADRVARLAAGLHSLGLRAGDRVGVLSLNSDRYLELYHAIWWAGCVVNPINVRWSPREIAYSLDDCQTQVLVVDGSFAPMVEGLRERSKTLRTVVDASDGETRSGLLSYEQLIRDSSPADDAMRGNDDLAGVFYTGGTTGFPKGVMLSHSNLWASAATILEWIAPPSAVGLHAAPMFHLADGMLMLTLMMRGCTHVIVPVFEPGAVLKAIASERVGATLIVPAMIQMLVDHPQRDRIDVSSLRRIAYGASPISENLLERAMRWLPGVEFVHCYGLTEMSPLVSVLGADQHGAQGVASGRVRSVGQACHSIELRIVDEQDRELPRGSVGEICTRGPGVMQGYWGHPEQTAAAIRDGWLHTGDGGYMDDEGFVFIVDRIKDMIVSGGENVYSVEVENAVTQHPAVAACAVIGIPDANWGEAVHAVIVCRPGHAPPGLDDLRQHCRALIAAYKCPRSLELREALPLSGAGKVLKTVLREPHWKEQQRQVG